MMDHGRHALPAARGLARLALHATAEATSLVEAVHATLGRARHDAPGPRTRGVPARVYESVRRASGVAAAVERALPLPAGPALPQPHWDAARAVLNGVVGDHLAATANPLAVPMRFRRGGRALPLDATALHARLPGAGGRLLLLVHGLCMDDLRFARRGHDHGAVLAGELGLEAVYLHYNTGRHVSDNGRELATLLERLVDAWPAPVEELALLGHSMGGLVLRSALHQAGEAGLRWPGRVARAVFLGTPHHGAPLERAGHGLQRALGLHPWVAPFARLGRTRSAGITDLRHGSLLEEDGRGCDRFARGADLRRPVPLPEGIACYALAGALRRGGPGSRLLGDGLVPVDSALGRHREPARTLAFPSGHTRVVEGVGHLDLLASGRVYAQLRRWLWDGRH